jgi:hypothetical protein
MRYLRYSALWFGMLVLTGLCQYEAAAKSPQWLGRPLPGWRLALRVEREIPMHRWTGLRILDRLFHEGQEALRFYGITTR